MAVVAHHHGFLHQFGSEFAELFIVLHDVFGHTLQSFFIGKDDVHLCHVFLTLVHILGGSSFRLALSVIFLHLLRLFAVEEHTRQSGVVGDGNGNLVVLRLLHGVAVHLLAEHLYGLLNRRAGKSHESSMRQGTVQLLGKGFRKEGTDFLFLLCRWCQCFSVLDLVVLGADAHVAAKTHLRAVCLVAQTDDVGAVGEPAFAISKFVYGGHIQTTAEVRLQFLAQILTTVEHFHVLIFQVGLGIAEQFAALVFQVCAVNDDNNRRVVHLCGVAAFQLSGEEEHRMRLAAPSRTEVGTSLSVASPRMERTEDVVAEHSCGKELGIAAYYLYLLACLCLIGKIDIVAEYLQHSFRRQRSLDEHLHLVDAHPSVGVFVLHLLPCVVIFLGRKLAAHAGIGSVTDDSQCSIFHHGGYVAAVSHAYLLPSRADGGFGISGILQFHDSQGDAVHHKHDVGTAVLLTLHHLKLVDAAEDIGSPHVVSVEVDIPHLKRLAAVERLIVVAIMAYELVNGACREVVVDTRCIAQVGYHLLVVQCRQTSVTILCLKIRHEVWLIDGIRNPPACHLAAGNIRPAHFGEPLYENLLVFAFVIPYVDHDDSVFNCQILTSYSPCFSSPSCQAS